MPTITPFLWFSDDAEAAASFYSSIFKDSKIVDTRYYAEGGPAPAGSVMSVTFEVAGQTLTAFNGGPHFTFTEAISLFVECQTQEEVDEIWDKLLEGGGQESQCGWLKDKYGLSWQIVPSALGEMLADTDGEKAKKVMEAMMKMVKIDTNELKRAYNS